MKTNSHSLPEKMAPENSWTRREFLRDGVRYGALAGLALVAARTATRSTNPQDQLCTNQRICGGCAQFKGCELPEARLARSAPKGGPA